MPTIHFNAQSIRGLKTQKTQEDFCPKGSCRIRGLSFFVRVYRSGAAEYMARWRRKDGKRPLERIGDARVMPLADAYDAAQKLATEIKEGRDPSLLREELAAAETLAEIFDTRYLPLHAVSTKKDMGAWDRHVFNHDIRRRLGSVKMVELKRRQVVELVDDIGKRSPAKANQTRALLTKLCSFAVEKGYIEASPAVHLGQKKLIQPKTRVLSDEELRAVWTALEKMPFPVQVFYKLSAYTGQRQNEILGARWEEIDEEGIFHIPGGMAGRLKNKRVAEHAVPLPEQCCELLDQLWKWNQEHRQPNGQEFLFPSPLGSGAMKRRGLERYIQQLNDVIEGERFTCHDFRRTCRTRLSAVGVSYEVAEMVIGHARDILARTYDHHQFIEEKRAALQKWADALDRIVRGEQADSGKVIRFRRRA